MSGEHSVMRSTGAGPTNRSQSGLKPRTRQKRPRYKPKVTIEQVDISDPDGSGRRISVSRNSRVDILAVEHSKRRISREARDLGRLLQCVYERAGRSPNFPRQWQPHVDSTFSSDCSIVGRLDDAKMLHVLEHWLIRQIGRDEAGVLRKILAEGWSYGQVAHSRGQSGTIASNGVANWFVMCLEELAEAYRTNPPLLQGRSADPVPEIV